MIGTVVGVGFLFGLLPAPGSPAPRWLPVAAAALAAVVWLVVEGRDRRRELARRLDDPREWLRDPGDTPRLTRHEHIRSALAVLGLWGAWRWSVLEAHSAGLPLPPVWVLLLGLVGLVYGFHSLERRFRT